LATIGVCGTTSRLLRTVRRALNPAEHTGRWRQVQHIGNLLINELLIGIGSKDRFSLDEPAHDAQFASYFLDPPPPSWRSSRRSTAARCPCRARRAPTSCRS
jgi:hypothetical protein